MSKIIRKSNFRVIVDPKSLGDFGSIRVSDNFWGKTPEQIEKDYLQRCKEIKDQIMRHVDDVHSVDIEYDTEEICSHCGYAWEIDPEDNLPLCCSKAIEEVQANTPKNA